MSPVEERFRLGGPLTRPWWTKTFNVLASCARPGPRYLRIAFHGDVAAELRQRPLERNVARCHQIAVAKFAVILLSSLHSERLKHNAIKSGRNLFRSTRPKSASGQHFCLVYASAHQSRIVMPWNFHQGSFPSLAACVCGLALGKRPTF